MPADELKGIMTPLQEDSSDSEERIKESVCTRRSHVPVRVLLCVYTHNNTLTGTCVCMLHVLNMCSYILHNISMQFRLQL